MPSRADRIALELNNQREAFKAFLVARVGSEAEAEDILQNGLVKALRSADAISTDGKASAWFYRLLRNAIVDHYRNKGARRRRDEALGDMLHALNEDVGSPPPEWEARICACVGGVIESLGGKQADLLRRVDLAGEPVQAVAKDLGMTPNNASVTLHRARQKLREKLEAFCGACADGACLDCTCAREADASPASVGST